MDQSPDPRNAYTLFLKWLVDGGTYVGFRAAHPEFSEDDITAGIAALPRPVVFPSPQTSYRTYGAHALVERLLALPSRPIADPPTPERIDLECQIVDQWAVELFQYCRTRHSCGLRMYAMISAAHNYGIRLHATWEAHDRIWMWKRLAERMHTERS